MRQRMLRSVFVARVALLAALGGLIVSFSACGGSMQNIAMPAAPAVVQGKVHGGQPAVAGASIQLFAVGTTAYGSASQPLLGTPAVTNQYGGFSFTNPTCPGGDPEIYLVATGGHTGTATDNPAITMMAAFGPCSTLLPTSFIDIDEVSTVAAVYALNPFMSTGGGQNIGAPPSNATGLANAFDLATNVLVDTSQGHGTSPGPNVPAGATVPSTEINTLAGIISNCINSDPATTECSTLFSDTTTTAITPNNTIDALLSIARSPGNKVATIFGHLPLTPPFTPVLGAAPPDWTMAMTYSGALTGPSGTESVAVDGLGNVWIANTAGSTAVKYSPTGELLGSFNPSGANLNFPWGLAIDTSNNVWIADTGHNDLVELDNSGNLLTGPLTGGGQSFNLGIAISGTNVVWETNYEGGPFGEGSVSEFSGGTAVSTGTGFAPDADIEFGLPKAIAVDNLGDAWTANYNWWSVSRLDTTGNEVSGFPNDGSGSVQAPIAIAIGASGNVWVVNAFTPAVALMNSAGNGVVGSPFSGGGLNPDSGNGRGGIAVDGAGSAWITNKSGNSISGFNSIGTALSPPFASPDSTASGFGTAAALNEPWGIAIDGSGNIWVANCGDAACPINAAGTLTEFIGLAAPAVTPLATAAANNTFGTLP